jgi:hypothetical protein
MVNATDRPVVTIGSVQFSIGSMDALTQWHVARRLSPILAEMSGAFKKMAHSALFQDLPEPTPEQVAAATQVAQEPLPTDEEASAVLQRDENERALEMFEILAKPITTAISTMSDADSEYIIKKCLAVCRRKTGNTWASVIDRNSGVMMYQDIDMRTMITLVAHVVKENLGDFFPTSL